MINERDKIYKGMLTNAELFNNYMAEPIKGAVTKLTKTTMELWLENDVCVKAQRANRRSHKNIKIGDLKMFQVLCKEISYQGKKEIRYALTIVGEDNSLLHKVYKNKKKRMERTTLRTIPEGKYIVEIIKIDEKDLYFILDGKGHKIGIPKNQYCKNPIVGKGIEIEIVHEKRREGTPHEYLAGQFRLVSK